MVIKRFLINITKSTAIPVILPIIYPLLPRGIDIFKDIKYNLPVIHLDTIFDIGANMGQSTEKYRRFFPHAQIFCFEPVKDTYRQLQRKFENSKNIQCYNLAFAEHRGKGEMVLQDKSDLAFLLNSCNKNLLDVKSRTDEVDVVSIDYFCGSKGINHINYLKIDTEGGDIDVLKGAEQMLNEHKIDIIEVEAGMNYKNKRHVPFELLKNHLEYRKYLIFGIYEQKNEWLTKEPQLRRANTVFISERVIAENKK